jgi:hypothetical protein
MILKELILGLYERESGFGEKKLTLIEPKPGLKEAKSGF